MENCMSNNSRTENHAGGTLENRKRWTSLSTNLARLTNKVNSSRADGMKQRVIEGSMLTSLRPHNVASPYSESLGAMKDKGFDNCRVRNVFSKGDLTQMTSSSSFEESSTATESSETGNYADKYGNNRPTGRPAF
ncbi:hypothetical protein HJC23_012129 [Cyclotella cryptica]|uniref:Uncharacterized protein n=1 Tax=Cyclotella cryptica TaxID=29204 RepID=A0ABD3PHX8_9STRA